MSTRRNFLKTLSGMALLTVVPRHVLGGPKHVAPSDQLTKGIIGVGGIGKSSYHFTSTKECRLVAVCDVDSKHLQSALDLGKKRFNETLQSYRDFRRLIADPNVDIVHIATPPHWHGIMAVEAAKAEADHVINTLKGFSPTYPVYFDLEEKSLESTSNRMLLANMASAFCDKIAAAGYTPGIYANTNWWNNYLTDPVFDQWERWVAQYNSKCSYARGSYRLWQCSASGKVDGIVGNVDLDLEFDGAFASNPVRKTWVKVGSNWYLRDSGGNNLIGWQVVDGQRYYLAASGVMQTGWVSYEGSWYYLSGSGAMKTGWARSGGKWYYLDPSSGKMLTGWQTVDGKRYYLTPGNGAMVTGMQTIGGVTYRFDDSGALIEGGAGNANTGARASGVSGWVSSGGHWYLKDSSGRNLTGWRKVGGTWYYMDASGVMLTGWQKVGGTWYYLKSSGAMATGWQKLGGTWYYLKASGAMAKGWYKVGGKWYYSNSSGAMQANRWIGNYYVTGSGAMATNTWIGRYHVNASGLWDKTR